MCLPIDFYITAISSSFMFFPKKGKTKNLLFSQWLVYESEHILTEHLLWAVIELGARDTNSHLLVLLGSTFCFMLKQGLHPHRDTHIPTYQKNSRLSWNATSSMKTSLITVYEGIYPSLNPRSSWSSQDTQSAFYWIVMYIFCFLCHVMSLEEREIRSYTFSYYIPHVHFRVFHGLKVLIATQACGPAE